MLVDDNVNDCELALREFSKFNCEVSICNDAEKAVPLIRDGKFDIVFLDMFLPKLGGDEILQSTTSVTPDTRFIIVTGFPHSPVISNALKRGAVMSFPKPLNEGILKLFFTKKEV